MEEKNAGRGDRELVRALSHPIRVEILETLQGRVASSRELSREMDRSQGVIAYHAGTLVKCGCLELVATRPRRGTVENYFGVTTGALGGQQGQLAPPAPRAAARRPGQGIVARARRLLGFLRARTL